MLSYSFFNYIIKCLFLLKIENVKAQMGICRRFQHLAAMYEDDFPPELLTLGKTKDRTLYISGFIGVSFLDHGNAPLQVERYISMYQSMHVSRNNLLFSESIYLIKLRLLYMATRERI